MRGLRSLLIGLALLCVALPAAAQVLPVGSVSGSGSGTVSSGTTNTVPKYTGATTVGDSLATDDGTTFTYSGTGGIVAGPGGGSGGSVVIPGSSSGTTTLKSAAAASGTVTLPAATDTLAGKATTDVLTNKTLDAEGTGNVITSVAYIQMDWAQCLAGTATLLWNTGIITAPTAACLTGSNRVAGTATWPDADNPVGGYSSLYLPTGWTGALDAEIWWTTTGTGNARFQIATLCYADDEADDAAFNTPSLVTAAAGTSGRPNKQTITGITTTGCAAGELMRIKFFRDRTEGSDTLNAALNVETVVFKARWTK